MSGHRLEANFHIITGQIAATNNITRCVERANLKVAAMTLEPIASAEAVLSKEEKEAGVVLVDIGKYHRHYHFPGRYHPAYGGNSSGGNVITKDIKEGCWSWRTRQKTESKNSDLPWRKKYNRIITIPGLKVGNQKEISGKIWPALFRRVWKILDLVMYEIKRSGYEKKLIGGRLVLTGGGALLKNFEMLCEYHTGITNAHRLSKRTFLSWNEWSHFIAVVCHRSWFIDAGHTPSGWDGILATGKERKVLAETLVLPTTVAVEESSKSMPLEIVNASGTKMIRKPGRKSDETILRISQRFFEPSPIPI